MTSDYDKPGPSSAGNFEPYNEDTSETRKINYDDCIARYRTDDDFESSDDENIYNYLHSIDGNDLVSEYRKMLNDDDEDDKRMNKILEYIYSNKETFSDSESSNVENKSQYKSFAEFISLLNGLEPSCSGKDGESINQETASKKETEEAAKKSTHKQKKNELDSANNDDNHRSKKKIASTDAKNLMKSPLLTKSKYNEQNPVITENLPIVKSMTETFIRKKEVKKKKKKMKSKTIKSRHEAKPNYSSSDDENTNVPLVKKKRLRCKTKAPKTIFFKDSVYDMSDESDDEVKDKKQTTKSKMDKQETKSIPSDDSATKNDIEVSGNSTDVFSNIRNILEQSLLNQGELMYQSNKESYGAILNIIKEYDNEQRNNRSTLDGTDETNQVLLEQSNKNTTVSAANSKKKGIKGVEAADLLSDEDPKSMLSPKQSLRLLKKAISANESMLAVKNNAIVKASKSQNKPRRQLKFNVSDEETADINTEVVKNHIKSIETSVHKRKTQKRGNISKSKKDDEASNANADDNEVGSSNKPKHLNLPKGETTNELQTEQGNDKLISIANQSQVSGFNETSDHVNANDKTILSPIFKSRRSPRSKHQSVIVNNTKNMMTSTPNQNSCAQPKTKMITKELSKKEKTFKSDLVRKANDLPKKKNISCNECDDDAKGNAIANVDPPIKPNVKVSRKLKELQNKKKLSTIDSEEEIEDKQIINTTEGQQFIGRKVKASTSKAKNLIKVTDSKDKVSMNESKDDEDNENVRNATRTVVQPYRNKTSDSPLIRKKAIASTSEVKKSSNMKMLIQDVESEEMKINPIVNNVKTKARTNNVKVSLSMKKSMSNENKRNATGKIKKGTKTMEVRNVPKSSARKVKGKQIMKKTMVSSDSECQNTCKENEVEDINVKEIETNVITTSAIKKGTKNKEQQDIINTANASPRKIKHLQNMMQTLISSFFDIFNENKIEDKNETNANATGAIKKGTKLSARKVKELQNMKETIVTSLSEEQDTCNENEVEDINVKESETNAFTTGAIKKENKNNEQVVRNSLKASTSKVGNLSAKKKAIVLTALEEQDSCSEIDNDVKNKEKNNIGSISQKRTKAAENKQVKNKKVKVSTVKVKESPKKNISISAKEHVSCEKDHDEGKENKSNTIVASTSQEVTKTVERQQVARKNTYSKRKLKETPKKKHGGTVASEEGTSHISKRKPKLNEVPNTNTTFNTDDEIDEVSPKKRAFNCMQNSSKYVCNFSLHNGENSSIKKDSGSVYDKKLQRLCDELNASRKSFDFSFENASLNDSVRRSGRSRKPPKLIECMYIGTVESSTSGKKSMSRKSTAVSQTDQENHDINKENLQVHDHVASQSKEKKITLRTKKTSVLKSSTMKKIQSNEESDGTAEKEDLGINEATSLLKPNKNVRNKNLGNESKISQTFIEKRKTADEDNVYSSQDNESTAESQISGIQSTSSTTTARKKRKLFSPDTYLNSSAIVKCCEYTKV